MKPRIALLIVAISLSCCTNEPKSPKTSPTVPSPEESYFQARDAFIEQLEKAPDSEGPALADLGRLMTAIVGPVHVEGFPNVGTINLETLFKELGFGQVDGLSFNSGREHLFVTTDRILSTYLADSPNLPKELPALSRSGEFYRLVFSSGAAVFYYAEVPVQSLNSKHYVHAFLGITAQDIGPFVPKDLFVFMSTGSRILAVHAPALAEITDIPSCKAEWEHFARKSAEASKAYRASSLEDKQALDNSQRYYEQGFEAYLGCYERKARDQEFFWPLQRQAQSIVDRLHSSGLSSVPTLGFQCAQCSNRSVEPPQGGSGSPGGTLTPPM